LEQARDFYIWSTDKEEGRGSPRSNSTSKAQRYRVGLYDPLPSITGPYLSRSRAIISTCLVNEREHIRTNIFTCECIVKEEEEDLNKAVQYHMGASTIDYSVED
jgi:hypothetical protein